MELTLVEISVWVNVAMVETSVWVNVAIVEISVWVNVVMVDHWNVFLLTSFSCHFAISPFSLYLSPLGPMFEMILFFFCH